MLIILQFLGGLSVLQVVVVSISKYNNVDYITIHRCIKYFAGCDIEYQGFSDSSEAAYSATLYLRIQIDSQVSQIFW